MTSGRDGSEECRQAVLAMACGGPNRSVLDVLLQCQPNKEAARCLLLKRQGQTPGLMITDKLEQL